MEKAQTRELFDLDVRHFIYTSFAKTSHPPTTSDVARHFKTSIARIESAFERLAQAHQIALAPGTYSIWMAHPFSGVPTHYVTQVGGQRYWGN